jgi:hypothetical protein
MCSEHWRAYVKDLRRARTAGKAAGEAESNEGVVVEAATDEAEAA